MKHQIIRIILFMAAAVLLISSAAAASQETSAWDEFAQALTDTKDTQAWIGTLTENMLDAGKSQEEIDRMIDCVMNYEQVEEDEETLAELLGYLAPAPSKLDLMSGSAMPDRNWKEHLQFMLDGESYDMPASLSALKNTGWVISDGTYDVGAGDVLIGTADLQKEEYLQANKFDSFYIGAGRIINTGDAAKDISECTAQRLEFDCRKSPSGFKPDHPDVMIAGGITFGSTADEIKEVLGDPDDMYRDDDAGYAVYIYWSDMNKTGPKARIELTVYDRDGVSGIFLEKDAG